MDLGCLGRVMALQCWAGEAGREHVLCEVGLEVRERSCHMK